MINEKQIRQSIEDFLHQTEAGVNDDVALMELVTDSFALVELVIYLQQECNCVVGGEDLKDVITVGDLIAIFSDRINQRSAAEVGT